MQSQSDDEPEHLQYKVVVVGDGTVGKTSLVMRFCQDYFAKSYKQTIGVDFFSKRLQLPNNILVTLQVWDIGGQSIFSKMVTTYIFQAQAVIFAYDITNQQSFDDVQEWLEIVKKTFMGKQMPLLFLAGNKYDLSHMRVVKPEAHTKLAASKSMEDFYVSAKTGDSVHEMFVKVAGDLAGVVISKPSIKEVAQKVIPAEIINHKQNEGGGEKAEVKLEKQIKKKKAVALFSDYKLKMRLFIFLLVLAWCYDDYDDFGEIVTQEDSTIEVEVKREAKLKEPNEAQYKSYDDDFLDIENPPEVTEQEQVVEQEPHQPLDWWSCKVGLTLLVLKKYVLEFSLLGALAVYLLNYFVGRKQTKRLALSWLVQNKAAFNEQFQLIGFEGAQREKEDAAPRIHGHFLEQQNNHCFVFYATGRKNMLYCHVDIEFQKRHDFITYMAGSLIWSSKDRVCVQIGLDYPEPVSPLCFAILPTKQLKDIVQNTPDLKALTTQKKVSWLEGTPFTLLAENDEAVAHLSIIKDHLKVYFRNHAKCIRMIHFTDQEIFSVTPRSARFDFEIPFEERMFLMKEVADATHSIIYILTDHMANMMMTKGAAATAVSARSKFEKKEKEERLQQIQKRKEQKRKEEIKQKESLSGVEQMKLEEKEKAKEKKKMMKRKFKVVKA